MSQVDDSNAVRIEEPAVLIKISRLYRENMSPLELYEATRGVWVMAGEGTGPTRKDRAEYAFAVYQGIVKEVYRIDGWYPGGTTAYETRPREDVDHPSRWEFVGTRAEESVRRKYVGRSVQHHFNRSSSPFTYVNCGT